MKIKILHTAICCAALLAACDQGTAKSTPGSSASADAATEQTAAAAPEEDLDESVILTVNKQHLTQQMFALYYQERMSQNPKAQDSPEMQSSVLNELANVMIMAQEAEKQHLDKLPEVESAMALYKAKLMTQAAIRDFSTTHAPNDEDIKKQYDAEYSKEGSKEYKARHILLKEEAEAKSVIEKLDGGADFAELAKEMSAGPTGKDGGDLGWFDSSRMVKPFADAVAAMKKGEHSKTPVQSQFGWHVILLEDTRDVPAPTLDSVKSRISAQLQQKALADYIVELRNKSEVKLNEKAAEKAKEREQLRKIEEEAAKQEAQMKEQSEAQPEATPQEQPETQPQTEEKPKDAS